MMEKKPMVEKEIPSLTADLPLASFIMMPYLGAPQ